MQPRNLRLDLVALVLLGFVAFLGVALLTYHRDDPVPPLPSALAGLYHADVLVYPPREHVGNFCGRWGALAADLLFNLFGVGAYYCAVALAALDVRLLRRQSINLPALRAAGFVVSLVGFTTLAGIILPGAGPGPVIGPGGYLGALGRVMMESHFATGGAVIVSSSLLLGGLMLSTDYAVIRACLWCVERMWNVTARGGSLVASGAVLVAAKSGAEEDKKNGLAVKINGKKRDDLAVVKIAEKDAEKASDEDDDDAPATILLAERLAARNGAAAPLKGKAAEPEVDEEADADDEEAVAVAAAPAPEARVKINRTAKVPDERKQVIEQLEAASQKQEPVEYELPSLDLLLESEDVDFEKQAVEVRRKAKILEKTFLDFGFKVKVVEIETGPVIAQYEVELEAGLRLAKITNLADDLAIALRVPSVRIVAPIPGKNTVGIEVPNEERQIVRLREVMEEMGPKLKKMRIPLFLGKDVSGNPLVADLATLPHLLIAGRTGTGKSVCLNAIICSLLMTRRPDEVRLLMIDPKMVELSGYGTLPHLMHPVVTDMRKAEAILAWAVEKMEERYALLARAGVRHLSAYNQLGEEELMERLQPENEEDKQNIPLHLPYIVIVADEMADLMMQCGKEVEQHIIRLAQKSRAVGIHLILATQKPTVDVITGLIKSNLPARLAFQVASRTDSRVVLDEMGADKLLGNGDMLFLWPGTSSLLRGQGTYLSDEEINAVVDAVNTGEQDFVKELVHLKPKAADGEEGSGGGSSGRKRDDLYDEAVEIVIREGRGSVSLLQRAMSIGYGRAARLVDFMAEDGIVGTYSGSQAREVLMTMDDWNRMKGEGGEEEAPAKPKRSNKVTMPVSAPDEEAETASSRGPSVRAVTLDDEEDEADEAVDEYESDEDAEADDDAPFDDDADSEPRPFRKTS